MTGVNPINSSNSVFEADQATRLKAIQQNNKRIQTHQTAAKVFRVLATLSFVAAIVPAFLIAVVPAALPVTLGLCALGIIFLCCNDFSNYRHNQSMEDARFI